jgi:hypothetical protein
MVAAVTPTALGSWPIQAACIVSEIAERLCELDELKVGASSDVIHRLGRLHTLSPQAYRITLQLFHGDTTLLSSFATQGAARGVTKQAIHKELNGELDRIDTLFPELAHAIREQRDRATHHEDPLSRDETNQQGMDAPNEAHA